jgi:hypothetical protein
MLFCSLSKKRIVQTYVYSAINKFSINVFLIIRLKEALKYFLFFFICSHKNNGNMNLYF